MVGKVKAGREKSADLYELFFEALVNAEKFFTQKEIGEKLKKSAVTINLYINKKIVPNKTRMREWLPTLEKLGSKKSR